MRSFYILAFCDSQPYLSVCRYEMSGFDVTSFWSGNTFKGSIPSNVKLWIRPGVKTDYLGNPVSWPIVSRRFWDDCGEMISNDCEVHEAPIFDNETNSPINDFCLLNPLRTCSALQSSFNKKGRLLVGNVSIDVNAVPDDLHIFRLHESKTLIIISDAIYQVLQSHGYHGIALIKTNAGQ